MKQKHVDVYIEMCLALAKASECPRRKFGALLVDPKRMAVLGNGYNGGPRGGGRLCGGERCLRDGLTEQDVRFEERGGPDPAWNVFVNGQLDEVTSTASSARIRRARLLAENPPIQSGTRVEIGCHHAEMNVICNSAAAGVATAGAWLFVTGEPCLMCAKLTHHAGIACVVVVEGGYMGANGVEYLRQHGVEVKTATGPKDPRGATP